MLKQITQVVGSKLMDLETSQTIGEVVDWIINPDEKKIIALVIKQPGLFSSTKVVTTIDIIEYGPGIVVVKNRDTVVKPGEVVRLKKLIKSKYRVIDSRVETESGKILGTIEDLLFETINSAIQKIYIKPGILGMLSRPDIIVDADKIIKIEPTRIIVQNDVGNIQTHKLVHHIST